MVGGTGRPLPALASHQHFARDRRRRLARQRQSRRAAAGTETRQLATEGRLRAPLGWREERKRTILSLVRSARASPPDGGKKIRRSGVGPDLLAGAVVAHGVEQAGLRAPLHRRVVLRGSDGLKRVAHLLQRGK